MFLKKGFKNSVVLGDCGFVSLPMVLFMLEASMFKFGRACLQLVLTA